MPPVKLEPLEKKVLSAVVNQTMVGGAELMRYTEIIDQTQIMDALKGLQSKGLVEISGDVINASRFPYAVIGIRPSSKDYLSELIKAQE